MNTIEQAAPLKEMPDFGMELDIGEFDITAAFQDAIRSLAGETELALEEKVRRMEVIVSEGTSETYRDFIDFRAIAAQIEMTCNHDHAFGQSIQGSESLSSFMNGHNPDDGHNHDENFHSQHNNKDDEDYEIDPKTGKKTKKKKRGSWLNILLKS